LWLLRTYIKTIYKITLGYEKSNRELYILGILESFNPKLFNNYDNNKACLFRVITVYNSILEYNEKLKYATNIIIEKQSIQNEWCKYNYKENTISNLLLDKRGFLIDINKAVFSFKENLKKFIHEYNRIKNSEDLLDQHNVRILSKFLNHILDVTKKLIEYTIH
jgi:hypothetical protein